MRTFFAVVVSLVLGVVIGAWQPRGEVIALRAELDAAREKAAKQSRRRGIEEIRGLLQADPPAVEGGGGERRRRIVTRKDDEPTEGGASIKVERGDGGAPAPGEEVAVLRSGLDARRAHALEALAEQGELDEAAQASVDKALADMNAALKGEIDAFVKDALAAGEVDRRDAMEFAANALDSVITADDALRAALPADAYDTLDDELRDPLSYVSGETVTSLEQLRNLPGFAE